MKINNPIMNRVNDIVKTGTCGLQDFYLIPSTRFSDYIFDLNMDQGAKKLLKNAHSELSLSEKSLIVIEKIAQGIQKLEKSDIVTCEIIAEAIQYVISWS